MIVKTLSKCIREYKKESILTPVYMAGEVFMEVAITYVLSLLIDRGITPGNMGEILRIGGLLILCALVSLAFGVMSGRSAAVASTGFAKNVRQDMYYNIQTFSFANIDKFSTASLITRLTTDVTRMQQAYMMLIRIAIRSPLMLIFSLIMSFRINARIATVFLCAVPVLGLGIYIMMSKAHPIYERVFKTYDELNRVVQENLRGIRVVKAFVREDHEREKFGKVSDTIYRDFSRAEKITTFGSPLMQASVYTCILLSSWLGAHIIVAGSMTTGQLMSVLTYAMSILSSLMMLSMVLMMLIISRASAERICEVLNERTDIANAPGAETVIPDGSVDFDGVSFSYGGRGGRSCLENIDLHIRSGETMGLIGGYMVTEDNAYVWLDAEGNKTDSQAFMEGDAGNMSHGFGNRSHPLQNKEAFDAGVTNRPEMRSYYYNKDNILPYAYDPNFGSGAHLLNVRNNVEPYRTESFPMIVYYDEETTLAIDELHTILDPYIESEVAKFITGARSTDEFPKFQEELKGMGVEELLGYYTTAYENYLSAQK